MPNETKGTDVLKEEWIKINETLVEAMVHNGANRTMTEKVIASGANWWIAEIKTAEKSIMQSFIEIIRNRSLKTYTHESNYVMSSTDDMLRDIKKLAEERQIEL